MKKNPIVFVAALSALFLVSAPLSGQTADRSVLVELLTTSVCANCLDAETALEMLVSEYGASSLCVVSYHDYVVIDPLATDETATRIDWYTSEPPFSQYADTFPLAIFDGHTGVLGAVTPESAAASYRPVIEADLALGSPVELEVTGSIDATQGEVTISLEVLDELGGGPYVLRVAVIEDDIDVTGLIFTFVARDLLEDEPLEISSNGDTATVERTFSIDPAWNQEHLDVIAFVQDDGTKEVLQSARLTAASPVDESSWSSLKALFR